MNYYQPYSIRFKPEERAMLKEVARRLDRTQQDTVRMLVRGVHEALQEQDRQATTEKSKVKA